MSKKKNLSLLEFLLALQKEYFICESRSKFYYSPNDKKYYKRVSAQKKEKILKIQQENGIPTIFNDASLFSEIKSKTLNNHGLPIENSTKKDIENYYSTGSDVKCMTSEDVFILGKIMSFNVESNIILVRGIHEGVESHHSCKNSFRIFS